MTKAQLKKSGLDDFFWAEAINNAVLIVSIINGSWEKWYGRPLSIETLQNFGAKVYFRSEESGKLSPNAKKGLLMGPALQNCGGCYRIYNIATGKIVKSRSFRIVDSHDEVERPLDTASTIDSGFDDDDSDDDSTLRPQENIRKGKNIYDLYDLGDKVQMYFNDGIWYDGSIGKVSVKNGKRSYKVDFENGDAPQYNVVGNKDLRKRETGVENNGTEVEKNENDSGGADTATETETETGTEIETEPETDEVESENETEQESDSFFAEKITTAFNAETIPFNATQALKIPKWKKSMFDELKKLEELNT
eukprot:Awhi_evm2s5900